MDVTSSHAYKNNPIGCLQERTQRETRGCGVPKYEHLNEIGQSHAKEFTIRVTLPNGLKVDGTANTKKIAKHNAARAMLDILDGRAKAINDDVRESIDLGLKALRGESSTIDLGLKALREESSSSTLDDFKPKPSSKSISWEALTTAPFLLDQKIVERKRAKRENKNTNYAQERKIKKEKKLLELQKTLPLQSNFSVPVSVWMKEMLVEALDNEIDKKMLEAEPKPEQICKLCNLVFISEKCCKKHTKGDFHDRVRQGDYPGKGGFHCFLCWVNYLQPESLLNHVSRPNHQARATKEGVLKVWMEPIPIAPTWDTIKMFSDLRELAEEEEEMLRGSRRRRRRSGSNSRDSRDSRKPRRNSPAREPREMKRDGKGRSPDPEIKAGVTGDWRVGREKTARAVDRVRDQERRDRKERDHQLRIKRERDERMRREWARKMRDREEMRYREREERRIKREREEIYWRQKEDREWRDWKAREDRRWREEMEWREREDLEWRAREERLWRDRETLDSGEASFFDSEEYRADEEDYRSRRRRDDSDLEEKDAMAELQLKKKKKQRDFKDELRAYKEARGSRQVDEQRSYKEAWRSTSRQETSGTRGTSRQESSGARGSSRHNFSPQDNYSEAEPDLRDLLKRKRKMIKSETRSESPLSESGSISSYSRSPSSKRKKKAQPKVDEITRHGGKMRQDERGSGGGKLLKVRSAILDILDDEISNISRK